MIYVHILAFKVAEFLVFHARNLHPRLHHMAWSHLLLLVTYLVANSCGNIPRSVSLVLHDPGSDLQQTMVFTSAANTWGDV